MRQNLILYTLVIAIFGSLLWFVFDQGAKLDVIPSSPTLPGETGKTADAQNLDVTTSAQAGIGVSFISSLTVNLQHPLSLLLIQIVVIVLPSRLLASLVSKIGQPMVNGVDRVKHWI